MYSFNCAPCSTSCTSLSDRREISRNRANSACVSHPKPSAIFRQTEFAASSPCLFALKICSEQRLGGELEHLDPYLLGEFPDDQLRKVANRRHAMPDRIRRAGTASRKVAGFRTRDLSAQLCATQSNISWSYDYQAPTSEGASPRRTARVAPTSIGGRTDNRRDRTDQRQRVAPTSVSEVAPTSVSEVAPTSVSEVAPTSVSEVAPTSAIAPTASAGRTDQRQRVAPTSVSESHRPASATSHRPASAKSHRPASARSHRPASADRTDQRQRVAPTSDQRGRTDQRQRGRTDQRQGVRTDQRQRVAPTSVSEVAPTSVRELAPTRSAIAPTNVSAIAPRVTQN